MAELAVIYSSHLELLHMVPAREQVLSVVFLLIVFFCFLLSLRTISPCYMHVRLWWNSWVQDCTFSRHMHMFELDAPVKLQNSLMYFPSPNSCALHHTTGANVTGVVVRAPVFQQWKAKCLLVSVYTERIQQS